MAILLGLATGCASGVTPEAGGNGGSTATAASGSGGERSEPSTNQGGTTPLPPVTTGGTPSGGGVTTGGTGGDAGAASAADKCPEDPNKDAPGVCGCGEADTDTDLDGTADCDDECVDDALKSEAGECGCGIREEDLDQDGAADCTEQCPDNAARTAPSGACGCSDFGNATACNELRSALLHLYMFDGDDLTLIDSSGTADGSIESTTGTVPSDSQSNGRLNMRGNGVFGSLPAGIISEPTNATFETWTYVRSNSTWARVFDFGSNDGSLGQTYVFMTSQSGDGNLRAAYSISGGGSETQLDGSAALTVNSIQHTALVFDDTNDEMRLYVDGALVSSATNTNALADVNDSNNYLGRSNYSADPSFNGALMEFRIYGQALTQAQISNSFQAGPGALK